MRQLDTAAGRFAARVAALAGPALAESDGLAVAVSGGPDSLALLLLAHRAFGARAVVLTVDHGLRTGSAQEAAMVASVAANHGLACHVLRWPDGHAGSNLQARARDARYALMAEACAARGIPVLMTAHHADDQAETLLLRLARGSGIGGLTGIRPLRTLTGGTLLVRPLLDVRRDDLAALVADSGLSPVHDPSNRDPRHDRTAARAALAVTPLLNPARLAAAAAHLGDAEDALAWTADLAWQGRSQTSGDAILLDVGDLPAELVRRLVVRALAQLGTANPSGPDTARLIATLSAGGRATLAGVAARGGPRWRFAPAPPRRA